MRTKRDITYKKILSLFRNQNGSPFFNAKGLAIGVFSAKLAKGNIILAAIGTWISNPFTYIPLYYFNYKVGSIFFNNSSNEIIEKSLVIDNLWKQGRVFSLKLLLGSSCVGFLLALICGSIVFFIYKIKLKK